MTSLLYLANVRMPTDKAYGIQITKMCEAFANQGIAVTLLFPFRKNPITQNIFQYYDAKENFKVGVVSAFDFYLPGVFDRMAVFIKECISAISLVVAAKSNPSDLIYSRDELPLYFLSFFRTNITFEAHKYSQQRHWYYQRFKRVGVKIVTISHGVRNKFLQYGFLPHQVLVAPDGVDVEQFQIPQTQNECRDFLKLPAQKKLVMYTGHLYSWKGVSTLADAAKNLDENFQVIVVGGSVDDMTRYAKQYANRSNLVFVGQQPHRLMPLYLKAADILVLPNSNKEDISNTYTSPLKMFEYMASGRPIIASDLPSIREILSEEMAYFVHPNDPEALARGIRDAALHTEESERRASRALDEIIRYSWASRARSILEFVT
jgi:glycosyltransferase involved in cell wall biosynthesis